MKFMRNSPLLFFLFPFLAVSGLQCFNSVDNSSYFEHINDGYCLDLLTWQVSQNTIDKFEIYDDQAWSLYQELYGYWSTYEEQADTLEDSEITAEKVTNDCLGVARITFCGFSFPYCNSDDGTDVILLWFD